LSVRMLFSANTMVGAGLLAAWILPVVGCFTSSVSGGRITTPADFTGFITEIKPPRAQDGVGTVFAESHADKLVHRYVIAVTHDTLIFRQDGDTFQPESFDRLLLQDQIRVWFSGPVEKTFPVQGIAKQVVIFNHYY
jgi:hypothetical protein